MGAAAHLHMLRVGKKRLAGNEDDARAHWYRQVPRFVEEWGQPIVGCCCLAVNFSVSVFDLNLHLCFRF